MRNVLSRVSILPLISFFATWLFASSAAAYELRKISVEEQVTGSEFIMVVKVAEAGPVDAEQGVHGSVTLAVESMVKGDAPSGLVVLITKGHLVEADPDCCEASGRYLVFVNRRADGLFYASNGPLSTFRIEDELVLKWPDGMADEPCRLNEVVQFIDRVGEAGTEE